MKKEPENLLKSSEASIVYLYRTLYRMRLSENGDMKDHVNKVQETVNRLNALWMKRLETNFQHL